MFRIGAKFTYNISETSAFSEEFTADIGEESTISKSVTALTAQVAGNLAMKASLTIKNNDKPAPGADETDSELGVNLVYSF